MAEEVLVTAMDSPTGGCPNASQALREPAGKDHASSMSGGLRLDER